MDTIFDDMVFDYNLKKAIQDQRLCRIKGYTVETDENLDKVGTRVGDFITSELSEVVNVKRRNQLIVDTYKKICTGVTVAFCVDVEHCKELCKVFNEN